MRSEQKLYVLVRDDLSDAQKAVQAGHAVAEYVLHVWPGQPNPKWDNGTLVYLRVKSELDLDKWEFKLDRNGIPFVSFKEPDMGDEKTALAACCDNGTFKKLNLLYSEI